MENYIYIIQKSVATQKSEQGLYARGVNSYEREDYKNVLKEVHTGKVLTFDTKKEAIDFLYENFEEEEILEEQRRIKGKYYFSEWK